MREVLEGTAAGLAARRASEAEVAILQELVSLDPGSKGKPSSVAGHNRRYHSALYHAAHNRYLLKTLNVLQDAMALLGPTTMEVEGRSEEAKKEHSAIVEAIAAKDAELAERLMRQHIRGAQKARLHLLASSEVE
jgi:DNA-binding FadR family transcriptional regulator